jgi:hypothetical protein
MYGRYTNRLNNASIFTFEVVDALDTTFVGDTMYGMHYKIHW